MKLGLHLGYWGAGNDAQNVVLAKEADRLGYDIVWTSEAYGSDAATVAAWVAAQTTRVDIGTGVFQIPGRTPANTAMTAATLDTLSGGRFRLGLGLSGPQVSEGWHGVKFDRPLQRTREYVEIVRMALARQKLEYQGECFTLPLPDGPGKALTLTIHPVREHIPIYLAGIGPKSLELVGEIADGWLAVYFSPDHADDTLGKVRAARLAAGKSMDGFEVVTTTSVVFGDDLQACADQLRPGAALYIGGMGSREMNFYNQNVRRMGFEKEAQEIQDKYLARDYAGAQAALPFELLDQVSLIGPPARVADRLQAFAQAGVTNLTFSAIGDTIEQKIASVRTMAEVLDMSGCAT
ncbi:MAG: LLM class F420-dependent oxidoreductase [Candidatus Nanopelagicales bacterium]